MSNIINYDDFLQKLDIVKVVGLGLCALVSPDIWTRNLEHPCTVNEIDNPICNISYIELFDDKLKIVVNIENDMGDIVKVTDMYIVQHVVADTYAECPVPVINKEIVVSNYKWEHRMIPKLCFSYRKIHVKLSVPLSNINDIINKKLCIHRKIYFLDSPDRRKLAQSHCEIGELHISHGRIDPKNNGGLHLVHPSNKVIICNNEIVLTHNLDLLADISFRTVNEKFKIVQSQISSVQVYVDGKLYYIFRNTNMDKKFMLSKFISNRPLPISSINNRIVFKINRVMDMPNRFVVMKYKSRNLCQNISFGDFTVNKNGMITENGKEVLPIIIE